jgi:Flp pilus assembly protein TadD
VLCLLLYLRYAFPLTAVPAFRSGHAQWWSYGGAIAACALSLMADASAVTLPIVLLVLDGYPLRRWRGTVMARAGDDRAGHSSLPGRRKAAKPARSFMLAVGPTTRIWLEKLPFFALAVAAGLRTYIARQEGGVFYPLAEHDVGARLAQACYGLAFYVWKTVLPTGLGPLYEVPARELLLGPMLWISMAVVVALGLVAVRLRRWSPAVPAVLAVYVIVLLPVLGIVQNGPQLVADRFSYLPCLGFAAIAGGGALRLLRGDSWRHHAYRRAALALVAAVVLVLLSRATFAQANFWLSGRALWARGVEISPNSAIAHANYADALARAQMLEEAASHYRQALRLNPRDAVALHHFADLQRLTGHPDTAIALYLRALAVDPTRHRACLRLAEGLIFKGRPADAVKVLRDGARRNPQALDLIRSLACLLAAHPDDSIRNGEEAVRWALYANRVRNGKHAPTLMTLATAYAEVGRFEEAVDTAGQALVLTEASGDDTLASELKRRLALFRQGKPCRLEE